MGCFSFVDLIPIESPNLRVEPAIPDTSRVPLYFGFYAEFDSVLFVLLPRLALLAPGTSLAEYLPKLAIPEIF